MNDLVQGLGNGRGMYVPQYSCTWAMRQRGVPKCPGLADREFAAKLRFCVHGHSEGFHYCFTIRLGNTP